MNRRTDRQRDTEPATHALDPELQRVREQVGPANYGLATAKEFARGGKFNPRPRPRYAIT